MGNKHHKFEVSDESMAEESSQHAEKSSQEGPGADEKQVSDSEASVGDAEAVKVKEARELVADLDRRSPAWAKGLGIRDFHNLAAPKGWPGRPAK